MKQAMTVLGPVPADQLGVTSMHEHILMNGSVFSKKYGAYIPEGSTVDRAQPVSLNNIGLLRRNFYLVDDNHMLDNEEMMTAEVADFKASGGSAMVDMSAPGLRCNLPGIQRISRMTGVHVITTTGLYIEDSWPEPFREMTVEQLTDHMIKEIEVGILDTGVKAGHIKASLTDLSARQEMVLRAAARTSKSSGLSVSVHQNLTSADCLNIVDIMTTEGMDPSRLIISHTDGLLVEHDVNTLVRNSEARGLKLDGPRQLLDRGVNLAIDCFGQLWDHELRSLVLETDWQRLAGVVAFVEAGYTGQIVMGTDSFLKMLTRRYGGEGYCRLTKYVLPKLKDLGMTDYTIRQLTVNNPARLLSR